jgi:signal transduction histidine kinase
VVVVLLLDRALSPWVARRLALSVVLISLAQVAQPWALGADAGPLAASTMLACAAVLAAGATFALLRSSLEDEHQHSMDLESSLLEIEGSSRGSREALHELKSTIAGLARASELLSEDAHMAPDVRLRMEQTVARELGRMQRLLFMPVDAAPETFDLDRTLDDLVDLHRAQDHLVAWERTGAQVIGRADDVAEAVNILLDNAAKHGDPTSARVEVTYDDEWADWVNIAVSDSGPGVPPDMRERIFEWGQSGAGSTGQGIGLHLAQRLVHEQGGSLTLAEREIGSSFVIRLPAARRSEENAHVAAQQSAS